MGKAVKKIPLKIREKYSEIPWKHIAGMRDKLIHEYHGVDLEIIWEVIKKKFPLLNPCLKRYRKNLKNNCRLLLLNKSSGQVEKQDQELIHLI